MREEIRFGVIGTGMMGIEHIENLQLIEGNIITAICDPNKSSLETANELTGGEDPKDFSITGDIDYSGQLTFNFT